MGRLRPAIRHAFNRIFHRQLPWKPARVTLGRRSAILPRSRPAFKQRAKNIVDLTIPILSERWRTLSRLCPICNLRHLQYLRRILARLMAASSAQESSSLEPHRITSGSIGTGLRSSVQTTWELEVAEGMLWPVKRSNQLGPSSSSSPGALEMRDFVPQCGTSWFHLGRKNKTRYLADPLAAHPPLLQRRPVPTSPSLTPETGFVNTVVVLTRLPWHQRCSVSL